jgi:hypothetical protein
MSTKYEVILLTNEGLKVRKWYEKLRKGFAHHFRPTYAGANMEHQYGVVETSAGLRGREVGHPAIGDGIEPKGTDRV